MALDRSQIEAAGKLPTLLSEEVPVPSLGGSVIVRGMLLSERLANDGSNVAARKPLDGETQDQARVRAGSLVIPRVLEVCVVDGDGKRLFSLAEWDAFGSANRDEAYVLFNTAMRLSGQDMGDVEKNSLSSRTDDSPSS